MTLNILSAIRARANSLYLGLIYALGAGLMWGLVFVVPLLLPEYPGTLLSFARYLAFGLIALIPAALDRRRLAQLQRSDWQAAFKLSLVGNIVYYALLASAIQLAGAPVPTLLIGTLPIVIAVASNWSDKTVQWRRLLLALVVIGAGLLLVNMHEIRNLQQVARRISSLSAHASMMNYMLGCVLAIGAVAAWTWYPIQNSRYLHTHPQVNPNTWATVQGISTLPVALIGYMAYGIYLHFQQPAFAWPFGPRPAIFIISMLIIGLGASWIGTWLWNRASQLLPTALAGQLIVFETLAALAYAFIYYRQLPEASVVFGIVLLLCGIILGVRLFRSR